MSDNSPSDSKRKPPELMAAQILARYQPSEAAILASKDHPVAMGLLNWFVSEERFHEAIEFMAYWLSPQSAIWWACLSVWETDRKRGNPKVETAMGNLIQWLNDPTDKRRRSLILLHQQLGTREPVAMICMAAFLTGGSISAPTLPPIKAPPFAYAKFVAGTINTVAAKPPPIQFSATCKQLLRLGMEVLQNVNHWKKAS